jgi:uncharacterized protein
MADADLNDAERDELQQLLDSVPTPLEPLDVSMLDGFLCGVLVQPEAPAPTIWLPHVTDVDARPLPEGFAVDRLHRLVLRRHAELDRAIQQRRWFDPWVFEMARADDDSGIGEKDEGGSNARDAVYPWVAGFALAMDVCPGLLARNADLLNEPLALLYRHLDPDDLEDAQALLDIIAALPVSDDLSDNVEDLVRATLLLADVGRPLPRTASERPAPGPKPAVRGRPRRH